MKKTNKDVILKDGLFRKLVENVNIPVMVTDKKEKIVLVNGKYLDFFRLDERKVIGRSWTDVIIPERGHREAHKIFEDMKKGKTFVRFDAAGPAQGQEAGKCMSWTAIPMETENYFFFMFVEKEESNPPEGNVIKRYKHTPELTKKTYRRIVEMFFAALRTGEPGTAIHSARIMSFAVPLSQKLGLNPERIERIKVACLLHDLGKLAIDEKILFKAGKLNKSEFEKIKEHPHMGAVIANLFYFLEDIIPAMVDHHENYDGSGYPSGIKGEEIPMEARILSVSDVYEALTADRPYRKGFSVERAIEIMEKEKGHKLDPKITDIFLHMVREGEFKK